MHTCLFNDVGGKWMLCQGHAVDQKGPLTLYQRLQSMHSLADWQLALLVAVSPLIIAKPVLRFNAGCLIIGKSEQAPMQGRKKKK